MADLDQYVDARVSRSKFDRELDEFRSLEADYRRRGWFLLSAEFPRVEVLMAASQLTPPSLVLGVAFDYTNYDAEPPSVRLVNPFTSIPYLASELPTRLDRDVAASQQIVIQVPPGMPKPKLLQPYMQWYSPDEVPFLCLAGVRKYHRHPAHSGDAWELHRTSGAGRLVRILEVIDRYGIEPIRAYSVQVQLVPQITGFQAEPPP